ncbi:MAG TPA: ABC transporter substrate-binding protein [Thermodesulfobacteriota bacterium]|nr:ABC transporter substrate-binding protein [Thermodesulfobacteriota bacterium]
MNKIRLALVASVMMMLVASFLLPASADAARTVYIGGTMSLTGPYAEDSAAILAAFEDYVKYVNETKQLAPWRKEKWPSDITIELLWRDDELKPAKALPIYEELKAKGILVYRCSGSPIALALKERLKEDGMGATSMATGPYLMMPPGTILTYYPIYSDDMGAVADWFKEKWKENRKPRVAYLTADNAMGKSIEIPEMKAYLEKVGYEFAGAQYVPLVPTSPPTTQLMWLKENKVDLALGIMVNPGSQPTVKEMVRLGMGPYQAYKMVFACGTPSHLPVFARAMGKLGDGFIVSGGFPDWDDPSPGIKLINELQKKYHPDKFASHTQYNGGFLEAMIQTEAIRLAMEKTPLEKLKPVNVLEDGFYKIKNLETGGISSTPLTYGPGKIEGVDAVRVDQLQNGKVVKVGTYPCRHLYKQ